MNTNLLATIVETAHSVLDFGEVTFRPQNPTIGQSNYEITWYPQGVVAGGACFKFSIRSIEFTKKYFAQDLAQLLHGGKKVFLGGERIYRPPDEVKQDVCDCELRNRQWNGMGRCLTCGRRCKEETIADRVAGMIHQALRIRDNIARMSRSNLKRFEAMRVVISPVYEAGIKGDEMYDPIKGEFHGVKVYTTWEVDQKVGIQIFHLLDDLK